MPVCVCMCIDLENDGFHLVSSISPIHSHPLHIPFISLLFVEQYGEYTHPQTKICEIWSVTNRVRSLLLFMTGEKEKRKHKYVKIQQNIIQQTKQKNLPFIIPIRILPHIQVELFCDLHIY